MFMPWVRALERKACWNQVFSKPGSSEVFWLTSERTSITVPSWPVWETWRWLPRNGNAALMFIRTREGADTLSMAGETGTVTAKSFLITYRSLFLMPSWIWGHCFFNWTIFDNKIIVCQNVISGAEGGNRTHTRGDPHRILSPARLPVPPLRQWGMDVPRDSTPLVLEKQGVFTSPLKKW